MNIYKLGTLWEYKYYYPKKIEKIADDKLYDAGESYFCNFKGQLSFDPQKDWCDIQLQTLIDRGYHTADDEEGDLHQLQPNNLVSCNSIVLSQNMVNRVGVILEQYGILLPLSIPERQNEGNFYFYWVTNELECIDYQKSKLQPRYIGDNTPPPFYSLEQQKFNPKDYYNIERLIIDETKYDHSMIFRVNNDFHSTIFVSEEFVELIKRNGLTGIKLIPHKDVYEGSEELDKKFYDKLSSSMRPYKEGSNGKFMLNDGGSYGDWLYYIIKLESKTLRALGKALDKLIEYTADMDTFLSYKTNKKSPVRHEVEMYLIRFNLKQELIEEKEFFEMCAEYPELHAKMIQYIHNITAREMHEDTSWQNDMHHRGFYAIAPLVFSDEKYSDLFGSLFNKWHMGGELYQSELLQYAFAKHGLTKNTMKLLAWRILCDGQAIYEDINAVLFALGIKEQLDINEFLQCIDEIITTQNDLKVHLVYSLVDFIGYYSDTKEEADQLYQAIQTFYNTLEGLEEEYNYSAEKIKKQRVTPHKYSIEVEKNWDKDPIESLSIGEALEDISNIKICV